MLRSLFLVSRSRDLCGTSSGKLFAIYTSGALVYPLFPIVIKAELLWFAMMRVQTASPSHRAKGVPLQLHNKAEVNCCRDAILGPMLSQSKLVLPCCVQALAVCEIATDDEVALATFHHPFYHLIDRFLLSFAILDARLEEP